MPNQPPCPDAQPGPAIHVPKFFLLPGEETHVCRALNPGSRPVYIQIGITADIHSFGCVAGFNLTADVSGPTQGFSRSIQVTGDRPECHAFHIRRIVQVCDPLELNVAFKFRTLWRTVPLEYRMLPDDDTVADFQPQPSAALVIANLKIAAAEIPETQNPWL